MFATSQIAYNFPTQGLRSDLPYKAEFKLLGPTFNWDIFRNTAYLFNVIN